MQIWICRKSGFVPASLIVKTPQFCRLLSFRLNCSIGLGEILLDIKDYRALSDFSEARPKNHEEVFRFLDDRKVAIPNRKPFKAARGWLKGFQQKRHAGPSRSGRRQLRLMSRASELFLERAAAEQRRLLQVVVEKAAWQDGALRTTLFEPFEILRHSNRNAIEKKGKRRVRGRLGNLAPRDEHIYEHCFGELARSRFSER